MTQELIDLKNSIIEERYSDALNYPNVRLSIAFVNREYNGTAN